MMDSKFEQAYHAFLERQKHLATGMRLEMLNRDLTGTKKLLEVLWAVFGKFDDMELEFEQMSTSGVKIYPDVWHRGLRIVFEAHGYVSHAEKMTREKLSFEQMRIRSFMTYPYKYVPFSWDELDKKPEMCVRRCSKFWGDSETRKAAAGWNSPCTSAKSSDARWDSPMGEASAWRMPAGGFNWGRNRRALFSESCWIRGS